jgi:hypothetical protein
MVQGANKTLDISEILVVDDIACQIADHWMEWDMLRQTRVASWEEIQRYIFATSTTQTSNAKLPWGNKTTLPKLTQIRDNLAANYMAALFPKRKSIVWEGASKEDNVVEKRRAIEGYMSNYVVDRNEFYDEVNKIILDYIDYGNCFAMPVWVDGRQDNGEEITSGYVGPSIRRISPLDIVFNPTAPDFTSSPKIIRSIISMGELKEMMERYSVDEDSREANQKLWDYMHDIREQVGLYPGNTVTKDAIYNIAGFDTYQAYLNSNFVEILTFYGDLYVEGDDKFYRNHVIQIVDRHKVLSLKPNPSFFGHAPIFHAGWRIRQDNLWAMGPLDNLIGMQYRIDHLENMKADVFDLIAYPPIKITGYVEDFDWGPFARIYIGDSDGDVELLSPDVQALNAETQIAILEQKMEEFAGSPKEAMGFRTPGEKTKYEVQRLENAAARIFEAKIGQFERQIIEPAVSSMLELAKRKMDLTTVRVMEDDNNRVVFLNLTREDITGSGRLRPVAARHFAEQAQLVQDITQFFSTVPGQDPSIIAHFSSIKLAKLFENMLSIEDWKIVQPYVRIAEQAEAQQLASIAQEQMAMEIGTPGGIAPGDYDEDLVGTPGDIPQDQVAEVANEALS